MMLAIALGYKRGSQGNTKLQTVHPAPQHYKSALGETHQKGEL